MTFKLEALEAKYGDSLLLHHGTAAKPRLIVIDGGPKGVYGSSLKPRLDQLRNGKKLAIDMLMVSHLDDDHVAGVVDLLDEMKEAVDENEETPYAIADLWINTFQDKLGADGLAKIASWVAANAPKKSATVFAASVAQGRRVRDLADELAIPINGDKGLLQAPAEGTRVLKFGTLSLTLLCPNEVRLQKLQKDWTKHIPKKNGKVNAAAMVNAAAYIDKSVYNLSSIVVLAKQGNKTMLLTGDARGDDIVLGLEGANLMKKGKFDCDILKLPHHGSDRNVSTEFFQQVRAKNYVISANGRFGNPDTPTLEMITAAREGEKFTIWLTNHDGEEEVKARLDRFFKGDKKKKAYTVKYRDAKSLGMTITP